MLLEPFTFHPQTNYNSLCPHGLDYNSSDSLLGTNFPHLSLFQLPWQKQLNGALFLLMGWRNSPQQQRRYSSKRPVVRQPGQEAAAPLYAQSRGRNIGMWSTHFLLFIKSKTPGNGVMQSTFKGSFLSVVKPLWKWACVHALKWLAGDSKSSQ